MKDAKFVNQDGTPETLGSLKGKTVFLVPSLRSAVTRARLPLAIFCSYRQRSMPPKRPMLRSSLSMSIRTATRKRVLPRTQR